MNRPVFWRIDSRCRAYTLIEILVATTLSLLLMAAVVEMFGRVGEGITNSRSMLESADRLRVVQARLQQDLEGVTVTMNPPCRPEDNAGYFEYIEGPIGTELMTDGTNLLPVNPAVDSDNSVPDTTVGDFDDILMFTTRSKGRPFIGRYNGNGVLQSDVAEVAWFLRGRTLYRRVLLVAPSASTAAIPPAGFYAGNDISIHLNGVGTVVPNTLGDLTRRECRFAHPIDAFPFNVTRWLCQCDLPSGYSASAVSTISIPMMPTLRECSSLDWVAGNMVAPTAPPHTVPYIPILDFWSNDPSKRPADNELLINYSPVLANGSRIADDVILTNVVGFDVKAWDPESPIMDDGAGNPIYPGMPTYNPVGTVLNRGAYVDLGYWSGAAAYISRFASIGRPVGLDLSATPQPIYLSRTYDTWSTHYESTGAVGLNGVAGRSVNGFDDDPGGGNGVVDDDNEKLTSPPYPVPLRGIQVKIRTFEPDSRQIREVTVVQDFLPQ